MSQLIPLQGRRPGRAPKIVLSALALVLVAGIGAWFLTRPTDPKSAVPLKDLPQGTVLSVTEIKGYEPNLTEAEKAILETGPDSKDKASVKAYFLAKAKLEPDPLMRSRLQQEAIALTDGYGSIPPVQEDNPQVRSMVAALMDGNHPERLNPLVAPKPFDAEAYKANPKAYLDVAEPGRAFQTRPASPGVIQIQPISPYFQNVEQGKSVEFSVKSAPGYPVTFTSFDAGSFGNGLTTETVEADSAGVAKVKFLGRPGNILEANILVASPMTSGQVRFKANTLVYADGKQVSVK